MCEGRICGQRTGERRTQELGALVSVSVESLSLWPVSTCETHTGPVAQSDQQQITLARASQTFVFPGTPGLLPSSSHAGVLWLKWSL